VLGRIWRVVVLVVGALVLVVAVTGMAAEAHRGNNTVNVQLGATTVHNAAIDDAYYGCLDTQAHSLVSQDEPVVISPINLSDFITMLKAFGSWVDIADPPSSSDVVLSMRDNVHGGGACLGSEVVAKYPMPRHGVRERTGSGASVPGNGPPPAPPL
jgi:hypothetical protein